jgi:hypothetical protein
MEEIQSKYNWFTQNTPIAHQEVLCGPSLSPRSGSEYYFIDKFAVNNILDVGCGTGHRTFPEFFRKNLRFFGIEKFRNLIDESRYSSEIVQGDLCSDSFIHCLSDKNLLEKIGQTFDLTVLLGGVVNGFITSNNRRIGWNNITLLMNRSSFLLFDTLTHFDWYTISEVGRVVELPVPAQIPPQYFYSRMELEHIFLMSDIQVVEEKSEQLGMGFIRTHFLLKRTEKNQN